MNKLIAVAAMLSVAVVAAPAAHAHAALKNSVPAAGATLDAAPKAIVLTFNEKIESAFSTITLKDAKGQAVAAPKAQVDAQEGTTLRLDAPSLSAGAYAVQWVVVGRDGHRRTGGFKFTVK